MSYFAQIKYIYSMIYFSLCFVMAVSASEEQGDPCVPPEQKAVLTFQAPPVLGLYSPFDIKSNAQAPIEGIAGVVLTGKNNQKLTCGLVTSFLLENYTENDIYGIHTGWIGNIREMYGLQFSFLNWTENICGLQIAVLANTSSSAQALQAAVALNAVNELNGLQIGLINTTGHKPQQKEEEKLQQQYSSCGAQIGLYNLSETSHGTLMQIGLINSQKSKGFQVGLLNFSEGGLLPFFPLLNFSF